MIAAMMTIDDNQHARLQQCAAPEDAGPEEPLQVLARLASVLTRRRRPPPCGPAVPTSIPDESLARLRRLEARFRALVEQIPAVTFMAALDGGLNEVYVSPQIEAMLGYTQREWLKDPVLWFRRLHPDDRGLWSREFARGCMTGGPFHAECRFFARDGSIVWVRGEACLGKDEHGHPIFLQGVAYDITESKRAEEVITASLREKETLLKEIHHRVKNNLQITSSLLKLQASRTTDEAARRALAESHSRVRAIGLVHEMLYRSADLSRIDLGEYVRQLVAQIAITHGPAAARIAARAEIDDVRLAIDTAVPCGLIISELVTNCFKHAFADEREGLVLVRLRAANGVYAIEVRDDGVGLPAGFDLATSGRLGLQLVRTLSEQVHAKIEISPSDRGTAFRITLPHGLVREHG